MSYKKLAKKIRNYIVKYNYDTKKIRKAKNLITEGNVYLLKHNNLAKVFLIKGKHGYYITVKDMWCSCLGFSTIILKNKLKPCYHLIATSLVDVQKIPQINVDEVKFIKNIANLTVEELLK